MTFPGPGEKKEHDPEDYKNTQAGEEEDCGEAPGFRNKAAGRGAQTHADIERRGVPAVGPAQMGRRGDAGHIQHGDGAESRARPAPEKR